jgi:hypothetical protein
MILHEELGYFMILHEEMIRYLDYYTCFLTTYQIGEDKTRESTNNYVDAFIYKNRQDIALQ